LGDPAVRLVCAMVNIGMTSNRANITAIHQSFRNLILLVAGVKELVIGYSKIMPVR